MFGTMKRWIGMIGAGGVGIGTVFGFCSLFSVSAGGRASGNSVTVKGSGGGATKTPGDR